MTMKQLKCLAVALTLLMGAMMSSCLSSDDSETYDVYTVVLVKGYMGMLYFEDAAGVTYYPTSEYLADETLSSTLTSARFGVIVGNKVESTEASSNRVDFTLKTFYEYPYDGAVVVDTERDMEVLAPENSPIISATINDGYSQVIPGQFNNDVIIVPLAWALESSETYSKHKLALACNVEEINEGDTELVLYVRHDNGGDEKNDKYFASYYGYSIESALEAFAELNNGAYPSKVVIKTHETQNLDITEMPEDYTEYTIDYKRN